MRRNFPKTAAPEKDWKELVSRHSPYLSGLLRKDTGESFEALLRPPAKPHAAPEDLMRDLRLKKNRAALLTAVMDLKGEWDDVEAMRRLSLFADFCVEQALHHLLLRAHRDKTLRLPDPKNPARGCGVTVIALGKWGAYELNYSSDIDLMVVFDPRRLPVAGRNEAQNFCTRLTRDLARLLDQPTGEGYVFRTDLRLRPDPGAMPLAVSIDTAEVYYGSLGQNWERAAMIKARPVAGDADLGADFMKIMAAWIWRRNLDFAAIQDINSIKRQINAKHNKPAAAKKSSNPFLGFNVKLGHGGIREIEFFAQTQQLIYGGRDPSLREPATLKALAALEKTHHISAQTRDELCAAYLFLRRVEHRLQMQNDLQTHSLPATQAGFDDVAAFLEYASPAEFQRDLARHTDSVKKTYAALFTESPSLAGPGNLVFTGVEDDPETLTTLSGMGFREPSRITAAIRGWHHGRYRAVRSERARQLLTELTPHLLQALGQTPHPDDAFIRFDAFLNRLPAGVPIFSMFAHNPQQMELVAEIMGASPAMAEHLSTHPQVLAGVLSKDFFGRLPAPEDLENELSRMLATARDYQDALDITRRFAHEKRFHAGIHILKNLSPDADCRRYFADIAETALRLLVPHVEKDFARTHGIFKTGEFIILGMGSFAARRMFADSDLDIVALYDVSPKEEASTGEKPLPPSVYYVRLMQRLVSALSAPTSEGVLYEPDMRLRPDGNKGPLAAALDGFFAYHEKNAWIWEHMSLIRSRPVYASEKTKKRIEAETLRILSRKRAPKKLKDDMLDMRGKVEKQFGSKDMWQVKYARGGIMDIMFCTHFIALQNAHRIKGLLQADDRACLEALKKKKLVAEKDFAALSRALDAALSLSSFLRLCASLPFDPKTASEGLKLALIRRVAKEKKKTTFPAFTAAIKKDFAESYKVFGKIFDI